MKNKSWIILIIIILAVLVGISYYFYINKKNNNNNNNSNYDIEKTSSNTSNVLNINNSISNNNNNSEEEIAFFSTKIYSTDSARQNNISITCGILDNLIIENNSVFSFCNTVGKATSDKGYQEADIFDKNGNKVKGLGGGNCQISTTLYNAVLSFPNLEVIERHEHSNNVPYIQKGKDAAVAYGSYDFKFKNNTGYPIKINAECSNSSVTIKLKKIK